MRLSEFLRAHAPRIVAGRDRSTEDQGALDRALVELLRALADVLEDPQGEARSSLGRMLSHAEEPLTMGELVTEVCSLRRNVLREWARAGEGEGLALADACRFDEALDQALIDSMLALGQRLDDAMNRSLAVVGHDLRNSLGAISMSASLLARSGSLPEDLRRPVGGIASTVGRMKHMVNDLEDLGRVRLGKGMPIVRARVDLRTILGAAVKEMQDLNPDFTIRFSSSGDLDGSWDGARIGQALANVVRHTAQYGSFREAICVSVEGRPGELVLSVSNRGLPAPEQPRSASADPMLHQEAGEAESRAGTGGFRLGLYIAAEIAVAHGGTLEVSSTEADGTVLCLRLPRK
jgi:signal transduction histidine kinase